MDKKRLAEIEERASAATPGPWRPGTYETDRVFAWRHNGQSEWVVMVANSNFDLRSDIAFAAHARQDVPDLVDAVRRLTAERDEARAVVAEMTDTLARAETELVEARELLAGCVDAMQAWGREEDGIPESGSIGEAYDAAVEWLARLSPISWPEMVEEAEHE